MRKPVVACAMILALGVSVTGCAVVSMFGNDHEGGSGRLSDAAAQASTDSLRRYKVPPPDVGYVAPKPRPADTEEPAPNELSDSQGGRTSGEARAGAGVETAAPLPPRRKRPTLLSVIAGGGAFGGTDYDGFKTFGLEISGYPESRFRLDLAGTYEGVNFTGEGLLGASLEDAIELNLDLTLRYYLTPDRTFVGIYPEFGLGTGTLFWDYAKPVTITEDGKSKTIDSDRVNYFSLFGGAGMSLVQTKYVHLGGNLIGGVRFYGWTTGSGLENDIIKPTGYAKALLELSFRVGSD